MKAALTAAFAFAAACSATTYSYLDSQRPEARDPATLATPAVLGLTAGTSSTADVTAAVEHYGLHCEDASLMAMMMKAHAAHRVSGSSSSSAMPSNHMQMLSDPKFWQVRTSCDNVSGAVLGGSPAVTGRLLVVHEASDKPVQLISFERHHVDRAAATADLAWTLYRLELAYGTPTASRGGDELALLAPVEREWHVAGKVIRFRAIDFGKRGTAISEEITTG